MKKLFILAATALMFASCGNNDETKTEEQPSGSDSIINGSANGNSNLDNLNNTTPRVTDSLNSTAGKDTFNRNGTRPDSTH